MQQTFEEKVRSMSTGEIIMAMVEGLKNPECIVNMQTFGKAVVFNEKTVCYGCAATNTVMKISNLIFTSYNIGEVEKRARYIKSPYHFLISFENAINDLRCGDIYSFNRYITLILGKKFIFPEKILPMLNSDYTVESLEPYEELAKLNM